MYRLLGWNNQTRGYFARKVCRSNNANQHECILLSLLGIVLFYLNSRGHNHTAQDNWCVLIRSSQLHLLLIGFVGFIPNDWLKFSAHTEAPLLFFFFFFFSQQRLSCSNTLTSSHQHTDLCTCSAEPIFAARNSQAVCLPAGKPQLTTVRKW